MRVHSRLRLQPEEADCSLDAQIAAWRLRLQLGGADCRLAARNAAWMVSRVALWNTRVQVEIPQVAICSSRWPFGVSGCNLKSRCPFGVACGHLECLCNILDV